MNKNTSDDRNPYISVDGQRELHKSIIAFIDVLGFKSLVKKAKIIGDSQEVFEKFHQTLSSWFNRTDEFLKRMSETPWPVGQKDLYKIRIFTDCIVIGWPIKTSKNKCDSFDLHSLMTDPEEVSWAEGYHELLGIISTLCLLQLEMINQGYFVRGAITVDEIYMDDIIIYGAGQIEAYEAEQNEAKYPRIILTKSAEDILSGIIKNLKEERCLEDCFFDDCFSGLYRDGDGYAFINYLDCIKIGDSLYQFADELEKHKQIIELRLKEFEGMPHCLEKYIWAASYHNLFCDLPPCYADYKIDLGKYKCKPITYRAIKCAAEGSASVG